MERRGGDIECRHGVFSERCSYAGILTRLKKLVLNVFMIRSIKFSLRIVAIYVRFETSLYTCRELSPMASIALAVHTEG